MHISNISAVLIYISRTTLYSFSFSYILSTTFTYLFYECVCGEKFWLRNCAKFKLYVQDNCLL